MLQETTHSLKCPQCPQVLTDMKSLQIHSFVEHHGPEHRPAQSQVLNLSQVRQARGPPSPAEQPVSCHICAVKLPNQAIFQQVRTARPPTERQLIVVISASSDPRSLQALHLPPVRRRVHQPGSAGEPQQAAPVITRLAISTL